MSPTHAISFCCIEDINWYYSGPMIIMVIILIIIIIIINRIFIASLWRESCLLLSEENMVEGHGWRSERNGNKDLEKKGAG